MIFFAGVVPSLGSALFDLFYIGMRDRCGWCLVSLLVLFLTLKERGWKFIRIDKRDKPESHILEIFVAKDISFSFCFQFTHFLKKNPSAMNNI